MPRVGELHTADSCSTNTLTPIWLVNVRDIGLKKMANLKDKEFVLVAEIDNDVVGFIAIMDVPDASYKTLVDNLHVRASFERVWHGGKLMRAAAKKLLADGRNNFYLWCWKGTMQPKNFIRPSPAGLADRKQSDFGGRKRGQTRYVWDDFNELLAED